jgi:hypothetical protein
VLAHKHACMHARVRVHVCVCVCVCNHTGNRDSSLCAIMTGYGLDSPNSAEDSLLHSTLMGVGAHPFCN